MAVYEESGRFDIELLAHVFADFDQVPATAAAGTGFGFVAVFDARQMRRQGLAAGARTFGLEDGRAGLGVGQLFDFGLDPRATSSGWIERQLSQFGERIHGSYYTLKILRTL